MIEKCKLEVQTQSMKNKEFKLQSIFKLKGLSVLNKTEKGKTKKLAQQLLGQVSLEHIFKDREGEKKDQN
jgi:hypothetical protein